MFATLAKYEERLANAEANQQRCLAILINLEKRIDRLLASYDTMLEERFRRMSLETEDQKSDI